MKKTILFANPCSDIGGAEVSLLVLLRRLNRSLYNPILLLPSEGMLAGEAQSIGVDVRVFPMHSMMIERNIIESIRDSLLSLSEVGAIYQLLQASDADLVHVNSYRIGIPFSLAARRLSIPSIWHLRDIPRSNLKRNLLSSLMRLPDRCIAVSGAVAKALNADQDKKILIIHNGVGIERFREAEPRGVRKELGLDEDAFVLCSIGALTPQKGHDLLIRAFARSDLGPHSHLIIVGGRVSPTWSVPSDHEDYPFYLGQLVRHYGLEDRVIFTGFRDDIPRVLASIDVYVHAATSPESFGRVVIEAMAASKPVIAPKAGGIPEIVIHDETGWLFDPGNLGDLSLHLSYAANNRETIQEMGKKGLSVVEENFTADHYVGQVHEVYAQLLGGQQRAQCR